MNLNNLNLNQVEGLVFLDVETTGTSPKEDQIVEVACVKVDDINEVAFFGEDNTFWSYVKADTKIKKCSFKVHGISDEFLLDKPTFSDIYKDLLNFISDKTIVAHNASFDMSFLNAELNRLGIPPLQNKVIDSLQVARRLYPGSPVGIDALISRFNMKGRDLHSARWDAEALARIYIQMMRKKDTELFNKDNKPPSCMEDLEIIDFAIE